MIRSKISAKRAETGGGAATLVIVIAALILAYILFLPPDIREELLNEPSSGSDGDNDNNVNKDNKVLLSEVPGRLDVLSEEEIDHTLPEIRLFTETSGNVVYEQNSVYLKKSWFSERKVVQTFTIKDLQYYDKFILSFNAPVREGRLQVVLNGAVIFSNSLNDFNVPPITLSKNSIKEGENTIEFSLEGTSLRFWNFEEMTLESIKLTADFTDISASEGFTTFRVSKEEYDNLEKARLRFFVDCFQGEPGTLHVKLNSNIIFSATPECDATSPPIDVTDYVKQGENRMEFALSEGSVSIFSLQIKSFLKEPVNPVYYFELEDEDFADVARSDVNLTINATFLDDNQWKNANLIVNGHSMTMTTRDDSFNANIDSFVFKGTNALEIIPEDTIDILKLDLTIMYP